MYLALMTLALAAATAAEVVVLRRTEAFAKWIGAAFVACVIVLAVVLREPDIRNWIAPISKVDIEAISAAIVFFAPFFLSVIVAVCVLAIQRFRSSSGPASWWVVGVVAALNALEVWWLYSVVMDNKHYL